MNKPYILILDDDINTRKLVQILLEHAGFPVVTASNGPDALEVLKKQVINLIITDYVMVGMDGFTFVRHVRQLSGYQDKPVIMLTARSATDPILNEEGHQINCYLHKPVYPPVLISKVRELLGI